MVNVFVTGIGGLLGSTLAKRLYFKDGYSVSGCDNFIGGIRSNILKTQEFDEIDILDYKKLKIAMEGADIVFHTAALPYEGLSVFSPKVTAESIVSGTLSVASAALHNNVKLFINCSSMARYGAQIPPFTEDMPTAPEDPYGLAKVQAEQHLALLNKLHGLNYVTLVPHNVIGKGQRYYDPFRNVVGIMINRCLQGKRIVIYGDGSQKRSFSDVNDCIDAVVTMMESTRDICGNVYNIGPHQNEMSIKELAFKVGQHCEVYPTLEHFPDRPAEVKNAFCSSAKIMAEFNYNTKVKTDQTIAEMVEWIKKDSGPHGKPFEYHLDLEFTRDNTPKTWTEQLI
tara:strand:+ start:1464 stop:2483 length:1020 start_codon:yes stop_codon:yes gene_type:complete